MERLIFRIPTLEVTRKKGMRMAMQSQRFLTAHKELRLTETGIYLSWIQITNVSGNFRTVEWSAPFVNSLFNSRILLVSTISSFSSDLNIIRDNIESNL